MNCRNCHQIPTFVSVFLLPAQAIGDHCNLWRNYADIGRSWGSVIGWEGRGGEVDTNNPRDHLHILQGIINFFVLNQEIFREAQGPGKWNDPDMVCMVGWERWEYNAEYKAVRWPFTNFYGQIIVGNTELSVEQAKVQMAIWSIW